MKAVTIISGGMDSTTLCYQLRSEGYEQQLLSFDYGQRHNREIECATATANTLHIPHQIIDLRSVKSLLTSSLTSYDIDVPKGHYSAESMKQTVVPGRNAIMLSIAWGVGAAMGAQLIAYGAHAGDHQQYPDCRPEFVSALSNALRLGTDGVGDGGIMALYTPYLKFTKADIVKVGLGLGVPYGRTWTCYEGGEVSCGTCGSCVERCEAFALNGIEDPLPYADRTSWKQAVRDFKAGIGVK